MTGLHVNHRRRSTSEMQREDLEETTSLLLDRTQSQEFNATESIAVQEVVPDDSSDETESDGEAEANMWPRSVRYLVLLCAFLTSLSFGVTQVPLLYVFRLMTCDAYYKDHPPSQLSSMIGGPSVMTETTTTSILAYALAPMQGSSGASETDRCSIRPIESSTALSVSLLGASTTVFGTLNLFLTGSLIKRIGVKPTLLIQVFFPALRLLVQNVGVEVWGNTGIIIIQCSQIVSIIGGPSGYLLVLNTFITEVVEHEGRTAALGRLTGSMMFGSATGFLLGGVVADVLGIKAPFRLTLILFLTACAYVAVFLPHIPPAEGKAKVSDSKTEKKLNAVSRFFGPLTVFAPRKFIGPDGVVRTEYGAFLLAWGVFLGILATGKSTLVDSSNPRCVMLADIGVLGYLQTLLQLYATDVFGFGTKKNGGLIFMYSMLRGVFLSFIFPKLISIGRKWTGKKEDAAHNAQNIEANGAASERDPLLSRRQQEHDLRAQDKAHRKEQTFTFDLTYTRFSLIADGILTLLCSFVREGWQMYLVAAILPFAAGTGSASKGTILQMVGSSASSGERTDALAGVSLVENIARLSTSTWTDSLPQPLRCIHNNEYLLTCSPLTLTAFVFGVIFAAFASIGRTELVFTCNAVGVLPWTIRQDIG